jgi:hypothetical protein
MLTLTLPPELEAALAEEARRKGTTVELLTLAALQERFLKPAPAPSLPAGATLADALADYIGAVNTKEQYPEGSTLSENTGRKFAQGMVEKYRGDKR